MPDKLFSKTNGDISGPSIGSLTAFNVIDAHYIAPDLTEYLMTGTVEDKPAKFPLAATSAISNPGNPYQFEAETLDITSGNNSPSQGAVYTSAHTLWGCNGNALVYEYDNSMALTTREIPLPMGAMSGQAFNARYIAYNHVTDYMTVISYYGDVVMVKPDGTDLVPIELPWAAILGSAFNISYFKGIVFDGTHYWLGYNASAGGVLKLYQLDDALIPTGHALKYDNPNYYTTVYLSFDLDTDAFIIGETYSYSTSQFAHVRVLNKQAKLVSAASLNNANAITKNLIWCAYNKYSGLLYCAAGSSIGLVVNFRKWNYQAINSNVFPSSSERHVTEAGGFAWTVNYSSKAMHKLKLNPANGFIQSTGDSFSLSNGAIAGNVHGYCGVDDAIWMADESNNVVHEVALNGSLTGNSFAIPFACRCLVSDGEFIYAISYNTNTTRIMKYTKAGVEVGEVLDHQLKSNYTYNLAWDGEFWVAYHGAYTTAIYDRAFKFYGVDSYNADVNKRPTQPSPSFALGKIIYQHSNNTSAMTFDKKPELLSVVGTPTAQFAAVRNSSNGEMNGAPLFERVK